nr:immunoglobulin light chain junction region [Macaca mulatta]MOX79733.1 immunoglobulin light chain junction region [Macaca mulatta]MOX79970.1 immunoglobulin light chain junction region [Macaca mulatta]MOX80720.1 immunoglobulin light chain junction region [Macaca mulatta]MOX81535.1 immunoglobulin light chain junction region [Macaca mulatta]
DYYCTLYMGTGIYIF